MYFVYIIKCIEGRFYIGSTENIEHRLSQHNSKLLKCWTNRYNQWQLVYSEGFSTRKDALLREKQIKSYKGGNAFKKLIGSSLGS